MLRHRVGVACIAIPALVEVGLGVVYLSATNVMPYHEAALGVRWSELSPGVRALLRTFLNGYGSAHLAVGLALGALVVFPLRDGRTWARWAILAVGLPVLGATAVLSARLAATTGADVPWRGAAVLLGLFVLGVVLVQPRVGARRSETLEAAARGRGVAP